MTSTDNIINEFKHSYLPLQELAHTDRCILLIVGFEFLESTLVLMISPVKIFYTQLENTTINTDICIELNNVGF